MLKPFDFNKPKERIGWIWDNVIRVKTLNGVLSAQGVGKSLFVEALAIAIIRGGDFMGRKTRPSNVLLIDQDTTEDNLEERLDAFDKGSTKKPVFDIFVEPTKCCSLKDGSLFKAIKDARNARVVIIDCLHEVLGGLNSNSTQDMSVLSELKKLCLVCGKTIIFTHHSTDKERIGVDELMTTQDTGRLSMGSSTILQKVDEYFVLGSKATGDLEELFIRPKQKRFTIDMPPFVARLVDDKSRGIKRFEYARRYTPSLCRIDQGVIRLLHSVRNREEPALYVADMLRMMHAAHWEGRVRRSIARLLDIGAIIEIRDTPDRYFRYMLNPDYKIPFKI